MYEIYDPMQAEEINEVSMPSDTFQKIVQDITQDNEALISQEAPENVAYDVKHEQPKVKGRRGIKKKNAVTQEKNCKKLFSQYEIIIKNAIEINSCISDYFTNYCAKI